MKRTVLTTVLMALLATAQTATATLLTNGTLESWSSSTDADNWSEIGTINQNSSESSPFTDVAALGSNSGTVAGGGNNILTQNFTLQTGVVQAILEFKFDTLPTNGDVYHWSLDNSALTAFRLSIGSSFGKYTSNTTGIVDLLSLTAGAWYQVFVDVDVPNQTVSGAIRPFGGSFTTFTEPFSSASVPGVSRALSPAAGFITGADPDQPLTFDNIYVGPVLVTLPPPPFIPEPASVVLVGLGGMLLVVRSRRAASTRRP